MKKLFVCCLAALCMTAAGCAGNQRQPAEQPHQADGQTVSGSELEMQASPLEAGASCFDGTWQDTAVPECRMDISSVGDNYAIEINWNTTVWQFSGTYDAIWEGIAYVGARYEDCGDGAVVLDPVPDREEITGLIYCGDGGVLYWIDDFDHAGDGLCFERG